MNRGAVIAAFPATGKSWLAANSDSVLDSDSSTFSWQHLGPESRVRHPNWPGNYIEHIEGAAAAGKTVLVSTHAEVRAALQGAGIPFTLVYPLPSLREEYRRRMVLRGSHEALVGKVTEELWDTALLECAAQAGCVHCVLRAGEHLADVLFVDSGRAAV